MADERMTGQKIEQAIELLMGFSEDTAKMVDTIENLEKKLAGFQALYEINKYMGSNLDLTTVITALEDIVVGVIGMSCCRVFLKEDILKDVKLAVAQSNTIDKNISLEDLNKDNIKELYVPYLGETPKYGLNEGCLLAIKMETNIKSYGYIIAYNTRTDSVPPERQDFFKMLVIQLCIYIENALLVEQLKETMAHKDM